MMRLAYLFSDPLTETDESGVPVPVDRLGYMNELQLIKKSLMESGRSAELRSECCTTDNLRTLVTLGYEIIHLSGHGDANSLLFEDDCGQGHVVSGAELAALVTAGDATGLTLAVVSACHSEAIGQAFVDAGVKHVVAIRLCDPVEDLAAMKFARAFYLALAVGKTIAQSFDIAVNAVRTSPGFDGEEESQKFILLPSMMSHEVTVSNNQELGNLEDLTPPCGPSLLDAIPAGFIGRQVDAQNVVSKLQSGRFVTVVGVAGIGKTALALSVAHYVHQRRWFLDGVFFVNLRGTKSMEAVITRIGVAVGLGPVVSEDLLLPGLKKHQSLLVLDNSEDPLHSVSREFRSFLSRLCGRIPELKVLVTSREAVGALWGLTEQSHSLDRLSDMHAADLLITRSPRELTIDEILSLKSHQVMKFLDGHPHAITLAAALLQHMSLDELGVTLAERSLGALEVPGIPKGQHDAHTSFSISLQISVDHVKERNPKAIELFSLMGLTPSGLLPSDLKGIWGPGWEPLMSELIRCSLVQKRTLGTESHYYTFPFITDHARRLPWTERGEMARRVTKRLSTLVVRAYSKLSTPKAADLLTQLAQFEGNIWACIDFAGPDPSVEQAFQMSILGTMMVHFAHILIIMGRGEDAKQVLNRGVKACDELGDMVSVGHMHLLLGDAIRNEDPQTAGEHIERGLSLHAKTGNSLGLAHAYECRADLRLHFQNDTLSAAQDYQTALDIHQKAGSLSGQCNCLSGLANTEAALHRPGKALNYLIRALRISVQLGDVLTTGNVLGYMARAAQDREHWAVAAHLDELSIRSHSLVSNITGHAIALADQAKVWAKLGFRDACYANLLKADDFCSRMQRPPTVFPQLTLAKLKEDLGAERFSEITRSLRDQHTQIVGNALTSTSGEALRSRLFRDVKRILGSKGAGGQEKR